MMLRTLHDTVLTAGIAFLSSTLGIGIDTAASGANNYIGVIVGVAVFVVGIAWKESKERQMARIEQAQWRQSVDDRLDAIIKTQGTAWEQIDEIKRDCTARMCNPDKRP